MSTIIQTFHGDVQIHLTHDRQVIQIKTPKGELLSLDRTDARTIAFVLIGLTDNMET